MSPTKADPPLRTGIVGFFEHLKPVQSFENAISDSGKFWCLAGPFNTKLNCANVSSLASYRKYNSIHFAGQSLCLLSCLFLLPPQVLRSVPLLVSTAASLVPQHYRRVVV